MSLRGKEVRALIDPDVHERLSIMAEHADKQINEFAARLLEKAIAGEWHEVKVLIDRAERLGRRWKSPDGGSSRGTGS